MNTIRINATGCALMDYIYPDMSFNSPAFRKYLSLKEGDGGLSPGKLVFAEEIEKFSGIEIHNIINDISGSATPVSSNIGGPAIVAIIHLAQLMTNNSDINFYGAIGRDSIAKEFLKLIEKTPLNTKYLTETDGITAFTDVLVDPSFEGGHGERCFINNIGAAGNYTPELITDHFFNADIVVFGGTALVPQMHDNLNDLLKKAKTKDCFTIVNTVYDFRNERKNPGKPWPLADGNYIDLLIMDFVEALKISGTSTAEEASNYFISSGVKGFIITNGSSDTLLFSKEDKTLDKKPRYFPVSNKVKELIKNGVYKGDTTGCGDNFCGGVIFSVASQIQKNKKAYPDLKEAIIWGTASGGFACSYKGGCYFEKQKGEKLMALEEIICAYKLQEEIV